MLKHPRMNAAHSDAERANTRFKLSFTLSSVCSTLSRHVVLQDEQEAELNLYSFILKHVIVYTPIFLRVTYQKVFKVSTASLQTLAGVFTYCG